MHGNSLYRDIDFISSGGVNMCDILKFKTKLPYYEYQELRNKNAFNQEYQLFIDGEYVMNIENVHKAKEYLAEQAKSCKNKREVKYGHSKRFRDYALTIGTKSYYVRPVDYKNK